MDFIKGNDEPLCYSKQESKQLTLKAMWRINYRKDHKSTNIKTNGVVLTVFQAINYESQIKATGTEKYEQTLKKMQGTEIIGEGKKEIIGDRLYQ